MAMEDDDDFCAGQGIRGFLLEDADDVVVLWARDGQRRRRHRRLALFPLFSRRGEGERVKVLLG